MKKTLLGLIAALAFCVTSAGSAHALCTLGTSNGDYLFEHLSPWSFYGYQCSLTTSTRLVCITASSCGGTITSNCHTWIWDGVQSGSQSTGYVTWSGHAQSGSAATASYRVWCNGSTAEHNWYDFLSSNGVTTPP